MRLDRNTVRLGLGLIAAFYVVVGGLFLSHYVPYAKANSIMTAGHVDFADTATGNLILNYDYHQARMGFYGSLLLWGTIALAAFSAVLWLTRRSPKA